MLQKKNDITSLLPFLHPYAAAIQKCLGKCALWMIFRSTENGLILVNLCNKKCMGLHILHWTAVRSHIRNASCSPFAALRFTDSACAASQCTEVQASCMRNSLYFWAGQFPHDLLFSLEHISFGIDDGHHAGWRPPTLTSNIRGTSCNEDHRCACSNGASREPAQKCNKNQHTQASQHLDPMATGIIGETTQATSKIAKNN